MKKQFSHRRNSGNTLGVMLWSFGVVFLIAILFIGVRIFFPGALIAAASPFWKGGIALDAGVGSAFDGLRNATTLAQENTDLSLEVMTLQNENAVLAARTQDLTKLLGGPTENATGTTTASTTMTDGKPSADGIEYADVFGDAILAGVLARPPESPYDTLIVSDGISDGVVVGSEAFAAGGIPIGTVKSVTSNSATVQLLSTPGIVTDGWVGKNRLPITLTGVGADSFTATLPVAASSTVGDSVYVPGPGAIPIGTIARIDTEPSSPTAVIHIQSLVNIFSLTWIEIARST